MSELLEGLNERQRAAVAAGTGPVLVLAGPGSGKTRVLTHRIAYLIQEMGVTRQEIMAVTFTNKAAGEMRRRAEALAGESLRGMNMGTFHAICARMLRREGDHTPYGRDYHIYDTTDQEAVIKQTLAELNIDPKKFRPRRVLGAISTAKNELITPQDFRALDHFGEIVARCYSRYQAILLDNNALDFDDLLMQAVLLLQNDDAIRNKYERIISFLLVDEFQDTNIAQYELVRLLAEPYHNVFVVGDEDQGIYAFRGADYRNVLRFREDYPQAQVILLEQNYRSTQMVLDAARAVIDKNTNRTPKALFTDRSGGDPLVIYEAFNEVFEANWITEQIDRMARKHKLNYADFAVMYRTNAQSRALEEAFIKEGIPYRLVGGVGFYKRREVRDLLSYLRVVNNPDDKVSFARIVNAPRRGIGEKSLRSFQEWAITVGSYEMALQMLRAGEETPLSGRVKRLFADFGEQIATWQALAAEGRLLDVFDKIMTDVGYRVYLAEISDSDEQVIEREENMQEIRGLLKMAEDDGMTLSEFLTEQSLVSDVDALEEDADTVTLLTLHAAKGLEFPVVFLAGLEEGLLPHMRSFDDIDGMEEERRLMYVGVTRAKDHLMLSYAFRRTMWGSSQANVPSRFLSDLPVELTSGVSPGLANTTDQRNLREQTRWDTPKFTQKEPTAPKKPKRPEVPPLPPEPSPPKSKTRSKLRDKIVPFPGSQSKNKPQTKFVSGDRVRHPQFGPGMVIESEVDGGVEVVRVVFDAGFHKQLDGDFLTKA